jgi:hypothetical protein
MRQGRDTPGGPADANSGNAQSDQVSSAPDDAALAGGMGARTSVDLRQLEARLAGLSSRNWGELPGTLKTRILQSASKSPTGDYARLIQLYFEELAKPRPKRTPSR